MWTFNRNYDDLAQVAEYLPAFESALAEIEAAGEYRYNNSFRGRIPGIAGPDEDTAIYLLQGLEEANRQDEKVAALIDGGHVWFENLEKPLPAKFAHVVLVPTHRNGGSFSHVPDARIVLRNGEPAGVLPARSRTRGIGIHGRRVLVKVKP